MTIKCNVIRKISGIVNKRIHYKAKKNTKQYMNSGKKKCGCLGTLTQTEQVTLLKSS